MQKVISILLIFCVLIQSFNRLSIIAGYELNKNFIASVLCVNKQKAEKQCQGKCYLVKQLKQADKHEHLPSGNSKVKADILFIEPVKDFSFVDYVTALTPAVFISHMHTLHL